MIRYHGLQEVPEKAGVAYSRQDQEEGRGWNSDKQEKIVEREMMFSLCPQWGKSDRFRLQ